MFFGAFCGKYFFSLSTQAKELNGKICADFILNGIKTRLDLISRNTKKVPSLAGLLLLSIYFDIVMCVGNRQDSLKYIKMKSSWAKKVGIAAHVVYLPEDAEKNAIKSLIHEWNENPLMNGILVQLPLPDHLDQSEILNSVHISKVHSF